MNPFTRLFRYLGWLDPFRPETPYLWVADQFIKNGDQPELMKHPIECDHCQQTVRMEIFSTVPGKSYQFTLTCPECKAVKETAVPLSEARFNKLQRRLQKWGRA